MGPDVQVPTAKRRRLPHDGCDVTTFYVRSAIAKKEAEVIHVLTAQCIWGSGTERWCLSLW